MLTTVSVLVVSSATLRRQIARVKGVEHVLPARRASLVEHERVLDDLRQAHALLAKSAGVPPAATTLQFIANRSW